VTEFTLVREIRVGDLLTAGSVAIGTLTLLYALMKDRRLRRREYADRIRRSASETLAAIERWREIAIRHFQDAQPLLTDADVMLTKEQDVVSTRDTLWRSLMALEAQTSDRVLSEKLEGAYKGLYGYDPSVHATYTAAIISMRQGFQEAHEALLSETQQDVVSMEVESQPYFSAQLGNRLRGSTASVKDLFVKHADASLAPLRARMLALVQASDDDIYNKTSSPSQQVAA